MKKGLIPAIALLAAAFMVLPGRVSKNTVTMKNFRFTPQTVAIAEGQAVTFSNTSKTTHTVTCDRCPIDAGDVQPGLTKKVTFPKRGAYVFYCRYHGDQGMSMRLQVGKPLPSPSPSPSPS